MSGDKDTREIKALLVALCAVTKPAKLPARANTKRSAFFALGVAVLLLLAIAAIFAFPPKRGAAPAIAGVPGAEQDKPTESPGIRKDITYCNGQKLDILYPRQKKFKNAPYVLYEHGGGWEENDKSSEQYMMSLVDDVRDAGVAVVSINYRKLPEAKFPDPVSDTLCAVRFMRAEGKKYGIDGEKVATYGFSAGGYLAAMAGVLDDKTPFAGSEYADQSSRVKGVVTVGGIFDLAKTLRPGTEERVRRLLAGYDPVAASVTPYVSQGDAPVLMVHGLEDPQVFIEQDDYMEAALLGAKVPYQIVRVANAGHGLESVQGKKADPDRERVGHAMSQFILNALDVPPLTKNDE